MNKTKINFGEKCTCTLLYALLLAPLSTVHSAESSQPDVTANWNEKELTEWFNSSKWKSGWGIAPDESINKKEFACNYFQNRGRWNKAFRFLATTDLSKIALGKYELEGNNLYVNVDEYLTKDKEKTIFEAHRKYADIQYVVHEKEKIGIIALEKTKVIIPYDNTKDVVFLKARQNKFQIASPDRFFVFFPEEAHRPGIKVSNSIKIRKVVVKVLID